MFRPIADIEPRAQNAMMDEDEQRWEEKLKKGREAEDGGIPMRAFAIVLAAMAGSAAATPPQMPIATGTIEAILPVIRAANKCGLIAVRLEPSRKGHVSLFADGSDDLLALNCAGRWAERNAKRLGLRLGYQSRP